MGDRLTVAVLGLADGPEADAGVSVLATLGRERHRRVGLITDPHEAGAWREGLLEAVATLPPVAATGFTAALLTALSALGASVVLPGSTKAAFALGRAAAGLLERNVGSPPLSLAILESLATEGIEPLRKQGLPAARLRRDEPIPLPPRPEDRWPMLFVAADGRRRLAVDPWDARRALAALRASGCRVSWAAVDPHRMYEVALVMNGERRAVGAAAVRVMAGDERARPWMALTVENQPLVEAAVRLTAALELEGPMHLLFVEEAGVYRALDIQPGFPVWIEVVRDEGPNLVELCVRQARGEPLASPSAGIPPAAPAGILFSQTAEDIVIDPDHPVLKGLLRPVENHD